MLLFRDHISLDTDRNSGFFRILVLCSYLLVILMFWNAFLHLGFTCSFGICWYMLVDRLTTWRFKSVSLHCFCRSLANSGILLKFVVDRYCKKTKKATATRSRPNSLEQERNRAIEHGNYNSRKTQRVIMWGLVSIWDKYISNTLTRDQDRIGYVKSLQKRFLRKLKRQVCINLIWLLCCVRVTERISACWVVIFDFHVIVLEWFIRIEYLNRSTFSYVVVLIYCQNVCFTFKTTLLFLSALIPSNVTSQFFWNFVSNHVAGKLCLVSQFLIMFCAD